MLFCILLLFVLFCFCNEVISLLSTYLHTNLSRPYVVKTLDVNVMFYHAERYIFQWLFHFLQILTGSFDMISISFYQLTIGATCGAEFPSRIPDITSGICVQQSLVFYVVFCFKFAFLFFFSFSVFCDAICFRLQLEYPFGIFQSILKLITKIEIDNFSSFQVILTVHTNMRFFNTKKMCCLFVFCQW